MFLVRAMKLLVQDKANHRVDVVRSIRWGSHGPGHALTIDELIVLDQALGAEQVADYVTAVQKLAEVDFPFEEPTKPHTQVDRTWKLRRRVR